MAHKQGAGSSKNNRDSISKRLGVKKQKREIIQAGNILIRQKGSKFVDKVNVYHSKDYTLHAFKNGFVKNLSNNRVYLDNYIELFPFWS